MPATAPQFFSRAQERGADALQLDLEDAVTGAAKQDARRSAAQALEAMSSGPADLLVRINRPWREAVRDLEAALTPAVWAITLPKAAPDDLVVAAEILSDLEQERGLPHGSVRLVAQIETAAGLLAFMKAAPAGVHPRLVAVTLGPEDFTLDLGVEPDRANLIEAIRSTVLIARAARALPLGFPLSIAAYGDLAALRTAVDEAYAMGARGAFCIHPHQVAVLNAGFSPPEERIGEAREVVRCFEEALAEGRGVASLNGRMIDRPVYERARLRLKEVGDGAVAEPSEAGMRRV